MLVRRRVAVTRAQCRQESDVDPSDLTIAEADEHIRVSGDWDEHAQPPIPYVQALMDALPAAVYSTDAEGRVQHYNRAAVTLSGRTPKVGTDRWCVTWKLFRPDGTPLPFDECPMAIALKEGRAIVGAEAIAERPDGTRVWFAAYPTPLYDEADRLIGGINMLVDISERKQAELLRTLSEDFHRRSAREHGALYRFSDALQRAGSATEVHEAALDAIVDGLACDRASILLFDEAGVMRFVAARGLSDGYMAAVEGHSPWARDVVEPQPIGIPDVSTSDLDPELTSVVRAEGIGAVAFVPLVTEGRLIGKFMGYFDAPHEFHADDFSLALTLARQLAFAIGRRATEDLRRVAARDLRFLVDIGERIRLATDADELLFDVARTAGQYVDVRRAMFIDIDPANDLGFIARDWVHDAESVAGEYRLSDYSAESRAEIEAGTAIVNHDASTDPRTAADYDRTYGPRGERAYVAVPLRRDGAWAGTLWVSTDVPRTWEQREVALLIMTAERAWNGAERLRLNEALREGDRRKDEFLATLAHELRNPLGPIHSALPLVASSVKRGEDPARWLEIIGRQTARLTRLVEDLVDVSRITSGHIELRPETVDMGALVRRAIDSMTDPIAAKRLTVTRPRARGRLFVDGDPFRLEQVVTNLLANAIKYTDEGGRITVALRAAGPTVEIRVADTGVGIDADALPRIFDLFEQNGVGLDRSGGGLGIGLTVAQRLVQLHGGTIRAESDGPGAGSSFIVRLPRAEASSAQESPRRRTRRRTPKAASARRVLVVDDNRDYAETLAEVIVELGHDVRVARDATEAMRAARSYRPDLVLLDIGLPGIDGYELGRRLRAEPATATTTLVALTGYGQVTDRAKSTEAGMDLHMVKPIELSVLEELIAAD